MKGKPPELDPRIYPLVGGMETLIRERVFRSALDALSEDVLNRCDEFLHEHHALILKHLPDAEPADIISAVIGWILGMPAGRPQDPDARIREAFQHNAIATFVSAWSAENSSRVYRRERQ